MHGLKLKIKPRISADNKVTLNVKTVVEDIINSDNPGLPTTSKREVETTTIVKNGQMVIIGGLVKDNIDTTVSKVPFIGDLPIFGKLFRHKEKIKDKTTLAVLLTPYIVKNSNELEKLRGMLSKLDTLEKSFVEKFKKEKSAANRKTK